MYARSLLPLSIAALAVVAALSAQKEVKKGTPREMILPQFVEEFVALAPGKGKFAATVLLGSSADDAPANEKPVHSVRFTSAFAIAKYEVTQELYELVVGTNPAKWKGPRNSVEMVNWNEANDFCKKVTQLLHDKKLISADEVIRLPSEAEWEYACRAGSKTPWSFGEKVGLIGEYSWYKDNSKGEDPPVGRKKPNFWGLYDMHGYVSEWCADAWHPDYRGVPKDGSAWTDGDSKDRVIRGGSFADPPESHRSAFRDHVPIGTRSDRIGFRCVKAARAKEAGK
jgi:formylglycine-generating enzyme required for sulfatase activity